jgi:hypothetical protein
LNLTGNHNVNLPILLGANRMIMMEVDWNPSNDSQVMGRIWRDGQRKEAHIYRLVTCGSIEERVILRYTSYYILDATKIVCQRKSQSKCC